MTITRDTRPFAADTEGRARPMASKIHQFHRKAQECETLAAAADEPRVRDAYMQLALQWLELAVQAQEMRTPRRDLSRLCERQQEDPARPPLEST